MFKGNNKNLCKVCKQYVTNKTGTQCKGICHGWVHFDCLHMARDKIDDIKCGAISLVCPCPSCKNPKESLYQKKSAFNLQKQGDCKKVTIDTRCPPQVQAGKCEEAFHLPIEKCEQPIATKEYKVPQVLKPLPCEEPKDKNTECGVQVDLACRPQVPPKECKGKKYVDEITPICAPPPLKLVAKSPYTTDQSGICKICGHRPPVDTVSKGSKHCKAQEISSQDIDAYKPQNKVNTNVCKNKIGKPIPPELSSSTQTSYVSTKDKEKPCHLEAKEMSCNFLSDCCEMKSSGVNTSSSSIYNVDLMCKAVGELTHQIQQLMGKMCETVKQRENNYQNKIKKFKMQHLPCVCTTHGNDDWTINRKRHQ